MFASNLSFWKKCTPYCLKSRAILLKCNLKYCILILNGNIFGTSDPFSELYSLWLFVRLVFFVFLCFILCFRWVFLFRCKLLVPLDFFYCISNTLLHDILYRFWFFITCKIHKNNRFYIYLCNLFLLVIF